MRGMNRRDLMCGGIGALAANRLIAGLQDDGKLGEAAGILAKAVADGQIRAAAMYVRSKSTTFARAFGEAKSNDAAFLLGSISKPISVAALMTLFDQGKLGLDDPVNKYIGEFTGGSRERITIRHLLTHVSGLPDQLPENAKLRSGHAPLAEFVKGAIRTAVQFEPGTRYEYSSMGILLAAEIAQRVSGVEIKEFVNRSVLQPLGMKHSALGLGQLKNEDVVPCQVELAAVESGAGAPEARGWDWNSPYWRALGAPWGGAHASAPDIGRFMDEFMHPRGIAFRPDVARLMIRNHNPAGLKPRGLGFDVSLRSTCPACSDEAFGHTGSTGTIAWADPRRDRICVVLTTLPGRATAKHPRQLASDVIATLPESV
jgi:CubicO group peptidase (beta-lactamase class C family)